MADNNSKRDLYRAILNIGGAIVGLYAFVFIMGHIGNSRIDDVPSPETLESALAPSTYLSATPTTPPPPLPPGFPSMDRPPTKIAVEPGQPQPIATKFGLTYDIPPDWRNMATAASGWTTYKDTILFGAIGQYKYNFCAESDGSTLAMTGATGRNGVDIDTAAQEWVHKADTIFADKNGAPAIIAYSDATHFTISGRPAVRYTATATNIPPEDGCDPPSATFDIIATPGYATAEVMIFLIQADQGLSDSLDQNTISSIISTIRKSED